MPQLVEVPGYGQVEFPDDMNDEQITAAIRKNMMAPKTEKPSTLTDIGRGLTRGAIKGINFLGDIGTTLFNRFQDVDTGKREIYGGEPNPPTIGQDYKIPQQPSDLTIGLLNIPKPETAPGRVADFAGSVIATGGFSPRALAQSTTSGLLGGTAGEAADKLFPNSPWLKLAAQMGGVLAGGLPFATRGTPAENIAVATKNLTPEQWKQAQALTDDAAKMGSPITGAEAIAQVAGKNSLQDIQRVVEQSKKGAPIIQPMMNQRPQANEAMFQNQVNAIAPMPANPAATPVNLQQTASNALTSARQAGNEAAGPFYEAAAQAKVPIEQWKLLIGDAAVKQAINRVKSQPQWGVAKEPEGSVRLLDAAKRWIDDQLQNATPNEARIWGQAKDKIVTTADEASQAYATARNIVAQNRQQVVTPMQNSPVGDLAATKGLSAEDAMKVQSNILMPPAPRALNPDVIKKTANTLKMQDQQALRDFTRQNLQAIFDETTQKLVSGENQFGGAKFAATIAGNPRQAENLKTLIESTAGGGAYKGFQRMLDVLEAQGKRQAAGSQTEFNKQISQNLSAGNLVGEAVTTSASPGRWLTFVSDWWDGVKYGQNTAKMAELLTDPKSVEKLRQLSMLNPQSAKARLLVAEIIAANQSKTQASDQSTP